MSNSTTDDDTKLKDIIIETLAANGALSDFKSKLSVEIVKTLETDLELNWGKDPGDQLLKTESFHRLEPHLQTDEGTLALFLILDTLEKLGLHHSSMIFKTEIGGELNLFRNKPKYEIQQILSACNVEGAFADVSDCGESDVCSKNKTRPILIELIGKMLRRDHSFSNETFTKSPCPEKTAEEIQSSNAE